MKHNGRSYILVSDAILIALVTAGFVLVWFGVGY